MRRVVITGMGLLTPLGRGLSANWDQLIQGKSGIKKIESFDLTDYSCKIAAFIPRGQNPGEFDPETAVSVKERRRMDEFIVYGIAAAMDAIEDAGWKPQEAAELERTGVLIGSGIGGIGTIYEASLALEKDGPRKISPFFIPAALINLISGHVSIKYGFKGPNHSVVTACATSSHAIGDASRLIMFGDADVMVAGGAEAAITPLGVAGFCAARALATSFNDTPTKGSRPWDKDRDGFVMGEGAGVVVLEEYEHAKKRGAKIYGEIMGYGLSGDAYHITAPSEDGNGGFRAMQSAMKNAHLTVSDIDYINAHGTSTPAGDAVEFKAVKRFLGDHASKVLMSSTKSAIGHLLGAAGAVEAIYSLLAMNHNVAPPTLNLDNVDPECTGIDLVPHTAKEKKINVALSNSFGFGGTNASLVFKKV